MSNNRKEEIFKCQCPVFDCTNTKVINWHHYGCSAIWGLYISDQALLRCENCGEIDDFLIVNLIAVLILENQVQQNLNFQLV